MQRAADQPGCLRRLNPAAVEENVAKHVASFCKDEDTLQLMRLRCAYMVSVSRGGVEDEHLATDGHDVTENRWDALVHVECVTALYACR